MSTDTVPSWVQWHMVLPHHWARMELDLLLSWSGSAWTGVTGGLPYTAGMTIGDIEGVNRYCFHLGSMAYGTSPPLG